jgi:hypothetical protein
MNHEFEHARESAAVAAAGGAAGYAVQLAWDGLRIPVAGVVWGGWAV